VAAWIEDFPGSKPTIKQKLAAVRMLYDFLVVRQITPSNPAHSVRGPKYVVKKGKTPVWSRDDAKTLLDSSAPPDWRRTPAEDRSPPLQGEDRPLDASDLGSRHRQNALARITGELLCRPSLLSHPTNSNC
jgi:hypothetical protein